MTEETEICCKNCKWFDPPLETLSGRGKCIRYPPAIVVVNGNETRYSYPWVYPTWLCGEYTAKHH